MIKTIIIGDPMPDSKTVFELLDLQDRGISIILCTSRIGSSVLDIFKELNGPHITDDGSVILNQEGVIYSKPLVDREITVNIVKCMLENDIYVEAYTPAGHYVQDDRRNGITEEFAKVKFKKPMIVRSLLGICEEEEVIKLIIVAKDMEDKLKVSKLLRSVKNNNHLSWTNAPNLTQHFAVLTNVKASKKEAVRNLNISLSSTLGIGASIDSWLFVELCGYKAITSNSSKALKDIIRYRKEDRPYIGENILDVLNYFKGRSL